MAVGDNCHEVHERAVLGVPIPTTWTHLNETAPAGSSTVTLKQAVTWKAGDQIAIASTGDR